MEQITMCTKCFFSDGKNFVLVDNRKTPISYKCDYCFMIANSTLNRQNKQHSVKTDETKLVLKQRCIMFAQNINIKQKKELCL